MALRSLSSNKLRHGRQLLGMWRQSSRADHQRERECNLHHPSCCTALTLANQHGKDLIETCSSVEVKTDTLYERCITVPRPSDFTHLSSQVVRGMTWSPTKRHSYGPDWNQAVTSSRLRRSHGRIRRAASARAPSWSIAQCCQACSARKQSNLARLRDQLSQHAQVQG
eukprot:6461583-Amphidinium_carterae.3